MAEFNNNPTEFVDFNDLFPVLNEKVGLTYEQWRKAIENINFVKANLGVSDVERGAVNISVVEDDALVGLDITTREGIVEKNGVQRTVIYLDFDLRVPSGMVKSVNGQTGNVVLSFVEQVYTMPNPSEDYLNKVLAYIGETDGTYVNGDTYKCVAWENSTIYPTEVYYYWVDLNNELKIMPLTAHGFEGRIVRYIGQTNDTYTYGKFYEYYDRETSGYTGAFRESKIYATQDDITNAIGNVSSLLGDTDDLEV